MTRLVATLALLTVLAGWHSTADFNDGTVLALDNRDSLVPPRVIHPRFREVAVPSGGTMAPINPPVFMIPLQQGKKTNAFSFRLSQDSTFNQISVAVQDQPFAVFNPHVALEEGKWYWQYKYTGGDWSEILNFQIGADSKLFVTPSLSGLLDGIPKDLPRSILLKDQINTFRSRNQNSPDALRVIEVADRFVEVDPPEESMGVATLKGTTRVQNQKLALDASKSLGAKVSGAIEPLVEAYLLTGHSKYAQSAIHWATKVASWDPDGVSMTNNFADSDCMLSMAMVFDACHDLLNEDERKQILESITVRGNRFYHIWVNNIEAKVFSGHVWQHIMERLFKTSIATVHEIPEAKDWLNYIYEVWQARSPILGPDDGGWWNGTHYFELNALTLLEIPLILKQFTGLDFLQSPFYDRNPEWLIYSFPPNSYSEGFGNGTEKQFGQKLGVMGYAHALGRIKQNPRATYYADLHLAAMGLSLYDDDEFRWFRLRWVLPGRPPSQSTLNLPLAQVFRETGTVNMHTNFTDPSKNLMVSLRASPYGSTSHAHADQNSFNIQYGGQRIFYNSGHRPSMGVPHYNEWFKATKGHNTILIDGKGQPTGSSESYGWIARFLDGEELSYSLSDASRAYDNTIEQPQEAGLKLFKRHLVLLRPDIVVIYDELEADHAAEWSWLLHSIEASSLISDHQLLCETELASSRVSIFASSPIDLSMSTEFDPPPVNYRGIVDENGNPVEYKDQWHMTARSEKEVPKMRYLSVFNIKPNLSASSENLKLIRHSETEWSIGNWTINAGLNVEKDPYLVIENDNETTALYYGVNTFNFANKNMASDGMNSTTLVQSMQGEIKIKEARDQFPVGRQ